MLKSTNKNIWFILLLLVTVTCNTFQQYKAQMEQIVIQIANNMERQYTLWQDTQNGCNCDIKSFNGCKGARAKVCDYQFPDSSMCLLDGQYVSTASSIKFPSNVNYNNLSDQDIRFVCTSAKLQNVFKRISEKRDKKFTWMYFGSTSGAFRRFPGQYRAHDEVCDAYDPRTRPWYTIAASGAKNVLILIDKSTSMMRMGEKSIIAASTMIDTLSMNDNVGVVVFTNETVVLGHQKSTLVQATSVNKKILKQDIQKINFSFDEETNFEKVFDKSLQMFNETIYNGDSGCSQASNIILLITDGNPTQGALSSDKISNKIHQFTQNKSSTLKRVIIFVYSHGTLTKTSKTFLTTLTCNFSGMVLSLQPPPSPSSTSPSSPSSPFSSTPPPPSLSTSTVASKLQQMYKYLSLGVNFSRPIWTEPYIDYYSQIQMVTVSAPAYHRGPLGPKTLIGVAGVDIILSEFLRYSSDIQQITMKLIGESACQSNMVDSCKLETLKNPEYRCQIQGCHVESQPLTQGQEMCQGVVKTSHVFTHEYSHKDTRRCCGLTKNQFGFIIGGSTSLAVVLVIIICYRKKIMKVLCGNRYRRIVNSQNTNKSQKADSSFRKKSMETINDKKQKSKNTLGDSILRTEQNIQKQNQSFPSQVDYYLSSESQSGLKVQEI